MTSQPLALVAPTIARIARLRDGRPEAAELAGGYPLRIVRVAPLHDAGITLEANLLKVSSLLSGRRYNHMHADELRTGHARCLSPTSERIMRTLFVPVCQANLRDSGFQASTYRRRPWRKAVASFSI